MNTTSIYKSAAGEQAIMAFYDQVLAHWLVPFAGLNIGTRHGNTFVIASGEASAPPLILLHGSCSNAVSWVGEVAKYSRHFRVYAVDIPGEPGKSAPNRPAWDSPAYGEWLEDLLDGLEIRQAALAGISLGGWMALKFATCQPERVARLVLLAPAGVAPVRPSFLLRAMLLLPFGRRGAQAINRITFGDEPLPEEAIAFMNTIMTHFRPRVDALPIFTDEELQRLTMPVLLIAGARDALLPSQETATRLARLLPRLTARILPEKGHVLFNLAAEIVPFLSAESA